VRLAILIEIKRKCRRRRRGCILEVNGALSHFLSHLAGRLQSIKLHLNRAAFLVERFSRVAGTILFKSRLPGKDKLFHAEAAVFSPSKS